MKQLALKLILILVPLAHAAGHQPEATKTDKKMEKSAPDSEATRKLDEATAQDLKTMQGKWLCEYSEESGKVVDKKTLKGQEQRMNIRGNNLMMIRLYAEKTGAYSGKFTLDKTSGHFDFEGKGPTGKPVKWVGIYELDRDMLKVCYRYQEEGKVSRPSEFKSDAGKPNICVNYIYKRERIMVK
jgi:uncharacterized protein (TIGR03067 family)